MEINKKKKYAAILSIASNIVLTILKIIAGVFSGSLSIISEAIHSTSDFLASIITFISVSKSSIKADDDHPYGHGKYEDLASFIEGLLIIFAAAFIIYSSVKKIILGTHVEFENSIGIAVMLIATIMNIIVSSVLFKVAKESNSISLYADGEHLRTDVYSSLGVFIGLILIKITGHGVLDPIIAILIAVYIYRAGYNISKRAVMSLLDYSLPQSDIDIIRSIVIANSGNAILKEHGIKARQLGPTIDIDLILNFPEYTPICECHNICDEIESKIQEIYINSSISIHIEPICYKKHCKDTCSKIFNKV